MRLLNTITKQLKSFNDGYVPPYAILSHVWGGEEDEVLFCDMGSNDRLEGKKRKGYVKVAGACEQAIKDGWVYIWIDTCCIDKGSSAELSEAINSMYKWYQQAEVCYVYLGDVRSRRHDQESVDIEMDESDEEGSLFKMVPLEHSRWFSRGWTLQELLAPQCMVFYSRNWVDIGTRASLQDVISATTGIRVEMLMAFDPKMASIAERMSWAARRKTTRIEDIAYCLMGLFGVSMPLLYGEGNIAFRRLQEEIMKGSGDHSLFAWKGSFRSYAIPGDADFVDENHKVRGMLANSPWDFRDGADIGSSDGGFSPYSMTNLGLQIQLPLQPIDPKYDLIDIDPHYTKNVLIATLKCTLRDQHPTQWIVIYLKMIRKGYYGRVFPHLLDEIEVDPNQSVPTSLLVPQVDISTTNDAPGSQKIKMKTLPTKSGFTIKGHSLVEGYDHPDYKYVSTAGGFIGVTVFDGLEGRRFAVVLGFRDNLFWLDVVDATEIEEWEKEVNLKHAYREGGRRFNTVLRHLDRLSARISDWSVVVSAKKFSDKDGPHLHVTVDIQSVPILARWWYTPHPISTSDSFDGDSLLKYRYNHSNVDPDFKKERGDWVAVFNPKLKRALDFSLLHSITCFPPGNLDDFVSCIRFSPEGNHLALVCSKEVRVYDTNTGAKTCVLFDEGNSKNHLYICTYFSPNGKFLATGGTSGRIELWDIEKKVIYKVLDGCHQHSIYSLCFSLDGRLIVFGSENGTIQIWDIANETSQIFTVPDRPDSKSPGSVAISNNGRLIAGGWDDTVWILDLATTQFVKKLKGYNHATFTPDGEKLLIGGESGLGYLDIGELVPVQVMENTKGSDYVGPDYGFSASGVLAQGETSQATLSKLAVPSLAVSHDGNSVICGSIDGYVRFRDVKNTAVQFVLQGHMDLIISIDTSPVGNIFATTSLDGRVRIWRYDYLTSGQ